MKEKILDEISKEVAESLGITTEEVDKVIMFQFAELREQMKHCNTLELTGIGNFTLNKRSLKKQIKRLEGIVAAYRKQLTKLTEDNRKMKAIKKKLESALSELAFLNSKKEQTNNETKMETDIGGMEEPSTTTEGS